MLYAGSGKGKDFYVHILVLEAFVSPRPPGMETCHRNGDRKDNRLSNLRWCTHKENTNERVTLRDRSGRFAPNLG
jgi:hypothetical protein